MSRVVPYGTRKFLIAIVTCRQVAWLLTIAVIIGEGGCIAAKQPSERAQLGTVGVVLRQLGPKRLDLPAKGGGEGTARGATAGARMALYGTGPLGLILWPFGAALGAVAGAAGAEDEAKVKAAQETLLAALNGFRPGEAIRDRLVDVARERTSLPLVVLPSPIETQGADTILEITVREFHLRGNGPINPPFRLIVGVRARLLRVGDFAEIRDKTFQYESRDRTFLEWAADNAQPLRNEFDGVTGHLARDIIVRMFSVDLSGSRQPFPGGVLANAQVSNGHGFHSSPVLTEFG